MGSNLGQRRETFAAPEDHSWLGSQTGTTAGESVTLKSDPFIDRFPTGIVPSGVVLARVTDETSDDFDLVVPYVDAATEKVQTVTRTATGGTVDITVGDETNEAVSVVAATTAAQVDAAIEQAYPDHGDEWAVTGSAGGPFVVTGEVPDITIEDANATGGTVVVDLTTEQPANGEEPIGHLYITTDVGTADGELVTGSNLWNGRVITNQLPTGHGLTARAKELLSKFHYTEG